jgi:hypothetical protein
MIRLNMGSTRNSKKQKWTKICVAPQTYRWVVIGGLPKSKECGDLPDYKTPFAELSGKEYSEWTEKERAWFEREYKRSRLGASPRGRKRDNAYDVLLHEREMAKLAGKVRTYWEQASKIPDKADRRCRRQRFIRASQRRLRIFSQPPKG